MFSSSGEIFFADPTLPAPSQRGKRPAIIGRLTGSNRQGVMAVFVVSYHLRKPERDYGPFFERLNSYASVQALETAWLVEHGGYAGELRDQLFESLDPDDGLLVALMEGEAGWNKLEGRAREWMLERFGIGVVWQSASTR